MPRAESSERTPEDTGRPKHAGAPSGDDESWMQDQGYPKLGRGQHDRQAQVEHGPSAGRTHQGTADRPERALTGSEPGR